MRQKILEAMEELAEEEKELNCPLTQKLLKLFQAENLEALKKKTVYISGPMTGYKDWNYPAFNSMADKLNSLGMIVLNPATTPLGMTRNQYMVIDTAFVQVSDCLVMLEGWTGSKGAVMECTIADSMEKQIINQEEFDPIYREWLYENTPESLKCTDWSQE